MSLAHEYRKRHWDIIFKKLKGLFPETQDKEELAKRRELIQEAVVPALMGKARFEGYTLGHGAVFNSGVFCVYWGKDKETGKIIALLHKRKETKEDGTHKFGAVGGYVHSGEQSIEAALRESAEELCENTLDEHRKPSPVFTPDIGKYVLVSEGRHYKRGDVPIQYSCYAYEMSQNEIDALKLYEEKCEDKDYLAQINCVSDNETHGIRLMPLEDIVKIHPDDFTFHRNLNAFQEVAKRLGIGAENAKPQKPSSPIGYTISDLNDTHVSRVVRSASGAVTHRLSAF